MNEYLFSVSNDRSKRSVGGSMTKQNLSGTYGAPSPPGKKSKVNDSFQTGGDKKKKKEDKKKKAPLADKPKK